MVLILCLSAVGIISISSIVGGSITDNCPQIDAGDFERNIVMVPNQDHLVKSTNGTLYVCWNTGEFLDFGLFKSTDGYNWSLVEEFEGYFYGAMALNSTGVLHILTSDSDKHIVFNLTTETQVTSYTISGVGVAYIKMVINSTDGIRFVGENASQGKAGLYFFNGSGGDPTWTFAAAPVMTANPTNMPMCIAANDTIYIASDDGASYNTVMVCWDESNLTFAELGVEWTGGSMAAAGYDILVNDTTIMVVSVGVGMGTKDIRILVSDLPAISWANYTFPGNDNRIPFFWMNDSRMEVVCPTAAAATTWNFSYCVGTTWTEYTSLYLADSFTNKHKWTMRVTRFHEPDFSDGLDGLFGLDDSTDDPYYFRIFPNNASSFLNLTVNTTYNELYSVNIDPKDLNPQDTIVLILQDTNAEDNWLVYSGGILSGTVGETAYNNTTVWANISFDDGTINFTYNFTFNSERQHLLYSFTLPHGYLRIHYRGTVSTANNTTWYAITNAGWASVDNTTGEITGYPGSRGSFWFHIYVNDTNSNNTDDRNFTVVIGIHPTDTPSKITYLVVPIVIAVVGLVLVVTILFGILRSMGSTFDRFGKS